MIRAARSALAWALLLALAACSKQSSGGVGAPIGVANLPEVRAGYWERIVTQNGGPPEVTHVCHTGAPLKLDGIDRDCSAFALTRTVTGAIEVNAACATGPVSSTVHETFSGDFSASYASDTKMTITLKGAPPRTLTTHIAMRYLGPCPPQPPPAGPSDAG